MIKLCKKYNREIPTEINIIYDVQANKLMANYKYDLVLTNDPNKPKLPWCPYSWYIRRKKDMKGGVYTPEIRAGLLNTIR